MLCLRLRNRSQLHSISSSFNWNASGVVCLLSRKVCSKQYVGSTSPSLRTRLRAASHRVDRERF